MIDRLRLAAARIGMPAWFVAIDLLWIAKLEVLAIDARHYQRAATAWLAGANPFAVTEGPTPYVSGPHTLLFYAPTSLLPLTVSVALWMIVGLAASFWLVRRLELPAWWILFPPLAHAVWNGNPQTIALALLVLGGPIAAAAAVGLKLYTGLALALRPRDLLVTAGLLALTLPFVPWQLYLDQTAAISGHLAGSWNGSAWRVPILVPFVVLALFVIRRRGAEWYAVGAIWPGTQFYYVSMALPAIVKRPLVTAALALPVPLMTPVVVLALALIELRDRRATPAVIDRRPAPLES
jgi:hypothetical protein